MECTVVSPVSVTKYRRNMKKIPKHFEEVLPSGKKISVYYPRFLSFSAKKIGFLNTYNLTIRHHFSAVMRQMKKNKYKF